MRAAPICRVDFRKLRRFTAAPRPGDEGWINGSRTRVLAYFISLEQFGTMEWQSDCFTDFDSRCPERSKAELSDGSALRQNASAPALTYLRSVGRYAKTASEQCRFGQRSRKTTSKDQRDPVASTKPTRRYFLVPLAGVEAGFSLPCSGILSLMSPRPEVSFFESK